SLSGKSSGSGEPPRKVVEEDEVFVTLVDDEGKPLKNVVFSSDYDSEDEVASVDNEMASFLAKNDGYVDNFHIQFGKEEFCLVSRLKFGVKNSTDYNKAKDPIPFRRRVFSSYLDRRPIRGKDIGLLIESDVFKKLDDNDVVSLCCVGILQLVLLGVEDRRHVPNWILRLANDRVSWDNYLWGSYTWILQSFRAATGDYYTRYRRHPRIVVWSSNHKFYRHMLKPMLHGQLHVERLVPDETEARSRWWVSSRAYFDGRSFEDGQIPRHLNRNNYFEVSSVMYREFEEQRMGVLRLLFIRWQTTTHSLIWQTPNQSNWLSPSNWETPNPSYLGTPNSQPPIPSQPGTSNWQNPMTSRRQDAGILDPVYMPINAGGVHWVTEAINLADSIFYVFYSMESEIHEVVQSNYTCVVLDAYAFRLLPQVLLSFQVMKVLRNNLESMNIPKNCNPENVRLSVIAKLQEALDKEDILADQILTMMHRYADRFTNRRIEINNLMALEDHPLVDYGKYALGCMTEADMKSVYT
nr:phospholipase-like protein [Tanacetum cinerariifolium]